MPLVLNRAAIVYLIAFIVFCIGFWAVLSLGSAYSHAPPDLSGSWHKQDPEGTEAFAIRQSGRFIQLQFAQSNLRLDLVLTPPEANQSPLTLAGEGWTLTVTNLTPAAADFSIQPPKSADQSSAGNYSLQREDAINPNASH